MSGLHGPLVNNFEVPTWAGKAPVGLHLDVMKETKMVQKLMIDEKKCYFFGRNKELCDFCIDHQSCSRVHAALVWHKHLNRPFIVDLGSTHGTYIGHIRLELRKPQYVPIDSEIHFGASTRIYIIRERPQIMSSGTSEDKTEEIEGGLLGLPESETELDNLTEFNTAHNRRVASLVDSTITDAQNPAKRKRRLSHVTFREEEEVINPEDIDPTVGRFRNLIHTTVIPNKKAKLETGTSQMGMDNMTKRHHSFPYTSQLYQDLPVEGGASTDSDGSLPTYSSTDPAYNVATKLGLRVPNLAPTIEHELMPVPLPLPPVNPAPAKFLVEAPSEPKKKKYAKEAWPGKKPLSSLLV